MTIGDMPNQQLWLKEAIDTIPGSEKLYKFVCFMLGKWKRKMSYQEYFLLLYGLNRRKLGERKSKEMALARILQIYKELHDNNLPKEAIDL